MLWSGSRVRRCWTLSLAAGAAGLALPQQAGAAAGGGGGLGTRAFLLVIAGAGARGERCVTHSRYIMGVPIFRSS